MKSLSFIISFAFLTLFFACQSDEVYDNAAKDAVSLKSVTSEDGIKIAIMSDLHVMHPALLIGANPDYEAYIQQDPKYIVESYNILKAAVSQLISQKPDLVLIPGDMTKDGELISHELVQAQLKKLEANGIKVLVTIGNHDINNGDAKKFAMNKTMKTETVQANKIPVIYSHFGFSEALYRDPNSLSYVAEPIQGLWIIAIDANKYYDNTDKPITSGVIKPATLDWVKARLAEAAEKGKMIVGMMHHGLVEHYSMQNAVDPGYVIDDYPAVADQLIDAGLKVIFTGHYHANDITKRVKGDKFVFDVETGSNVNYPCAYRMLTIKDNKFKFEFQPILPYSLPGSAAQLYSQKYLGIYFTNLLMARGFPQSDAAALAPAFAWSAMTHFAGDEPAIPTQILGVISMLEGNAQTYGLGLAMESLWTDLGVPDNNVTLNMTDGTFSAN